LEKFSLAEFGHRSTDGVSSLGSEQGERMELEHGDEGGDEARYDGDDVDEAKLQVSRRWSTIMQSDSGGD
jgi:hypothetical protein